MYAIRSYYERGDGGPQQPCAAHDGDLVVAALYQRNQQPDREPGARRGVELAGGDRGIREVEERELA